MYLPKISVITPSYNQGNFIEQTIESVLNQNYPNLEYIIMDGDSTDGTLEILRRYDTKIIWKSEKDKGQSHAINKGLSLATGEIVAYINSDDVYEKDTFYKVAEFFKNNPQVRWVYGKCRIIDEKGQEIRRAITFYKNFLLKSFNYSKLLAVNFISQPTVFWRKSLIKEIGLFNENLFYSMDYEYLVRTAKLHPPGILNEYLAKFRVHSGSKASRGFLRQFKLELDIAKKYSANPIPILLHYLNYLSIITTYFFLYQVGRHKSDK